MKRCDACKLDKPINEFRRHAQSKDGHMSTCEGCMAAVREARKQARLAKVLTYNYFIHPSLGAMRIPRERLSSAPAFARHLREIGWRETSHAVYVDVGKQADKYWAAVNKTDGYYYGGNQWQAA